MLQYDAVVMAAEFVLKSLKSVKLASCRVLILSPGRVSSEMYSAVAWQENEEPSTVGAVSAHSLANSKVVGV